MYVQRENIAHVYVSDEETYNSLRIYSRTAFNNAQGVSMFIEKQEEDISSFLVLIKIAGVPLVKKWMEKEKENDWPSKMEITIIKMKH